MKTENFQDKSLELSGYNAYEDATKKLQSDFNNKMILTRNDADREFVYNQWVNEHNEATTTLNKDLNFPGAIDSSVKLVLRGNNYLFYDKVLAEKHSEFNTPNKIKQAIVNIFTYRAYFDFHPDLDEALNLKPSSENIIYAINNGGGEFIMAKISESLSPEDLKVLDNSMTLFGLDFKEILGNGIMNIVEVNGNPVVDIPKFQDVIINNVEGLAKLTPEQEILLFNFYNLMTIKVCFAICSFFIATGIIDTAINYVTALIENLKLYKTISGDNWTSYMDENITKLTSLKEDLEKKLKKNADPISKKPKNKGDKKVKLENNKSLNINTTYFKLIKGMSRELCRNKYFAMPTDFERVFTEHVPTTWLQRDIKTLAHLLFILNKNEIIIPVKGYFKIASEYFLDKSGKKISGKNLKDWSSLITKDGTGKYLTIKNFLKKLIETKAK